MWFLFGKCLWKTGQTSDAVRAFTAAREISPKMEGAIKIAMGKGDGGEDEDD
jgi:cytochrome c-type biogenesis protein CcmH/NrfG